MKSHKIAAMTLILLAAMLIVPCWSQTSAPEAKAKPEIKPLDTNISSVGKLFPADTKVLIQIDLHALVKSDVVLRKDVFKKIPGFDKFYEVIKKAEISPFYIEKDKIEWTLSDNVKTIYIAKSSFSDDENDISVLLVGKANLQFTAERFKENEKITVKADEKIKGYEITGLLSKDETLYLSQLNGAIVIARTPEVAAGYLDRYAKDDKAEGMKTNEIMYHLAEAQFMGRNILNAVVLFDKEQREKFAQADDETRIFKDIKTFSLGIRSNMGGTYSLESRSECVNEQAAKDIGEKLKVLKFGATLAASEPKLRRLYNSVEIKTPKAAIVLEMTFNVEQIKLLAFGGEKKEAAETNDTTDTP